MKDKHRRLIEWFRLLAGYSFVQIIAQALGFFAGIMVVRTLSKEDYACFLIVNTIGPIMNMLSDNGITSSLSAIGGKFWQDDVQMGSLIKTAMILRRRLVVISFSAITPLLVWMLWHNNARISTIAWLVLITLAGVFFQLNVGVFSTVVNLRQQVGRMQMLILLGVLPRLGFIVLFAALGLLNAPLATAAATVALAGQFWLLQYWVRPQISLSAPPNTEFKKAILAIVKKQAPLTIYICLQSQIGIWLISIFGNVHRVAELGALGRIGMLFSIFISISSAIVVPRFARCQDMIVLRSRYVFIVFGFLGIVILATLLAWLFPYPLIWIIGSQYQKLGGLVWLAVLTSGTWILVDVIQSLNLNKGWIPPVAIVIPAAIIVQVILCLNFDLASVRGILLMTLLSPVMAGLINFFVGIRKLNCGARLKSA